MRSDGWIGLSFTKTKTWGRGREDSVLRVGLRVEAWAKNRSIPGSLEPGDSSLAMRGATSLVEK